MCDGQTYSKNLHNNEKITPRGDEKAVGFVVV